MEGRLYTQEQRRLHRELESTLTPKQRQLLVVGALSKEICTPQQIEILRRMDPYLEGLTVEQAKRYIPDCYTTSLHCLVELLLVMCGASERYPRHLLSPARMTGARR